MSGGAASCCLATPQRAHGCCFISPLRAARPMLAAGGSNAGTRLPRQLFGSWCAAGAPSAGRGVAGRAAGVGEGEGQSLDESGHRAGNDLRAPPSQGQVKLAVEWSRVEWTPAAGRWAEVRAGALRQATQRSQRRGTQLPAGASWPGSAWEAAGAEPLSTLDAPDPGSQPRGPPAWHAA